MADAHAGLIRSLLAQVDGQATLIDSSSRPWASVTFTGARHRLRISAPAGAADWLTERLDEIEFIIPGHIVADIVLTECTVSDGLFALAIEALTIEDA
jgi:hypothetical protein